MIPNRKNELAKIHIAKKQLGLDDDTYRQMLWTVVRVKSAGDLDFAGRQKVLAHLHGCGFRARRNTKPYPGKPHNIEHSRQLKKIEALLADMKLPWSYADAIAKQMYGIAKVAWLKPTEHKQALITALIKKQKAMQQEKDHVS